MTNKLTDVQVKRLAEFRDKWLKIGLSTKPADRPTAEQGVRKAYEAAGLPAPKIFIWLRSPREGAIAAMMLKDLPREQVRAQVREQVRAQVRDQVREQVWGQVWEQVGSQVWEQVGDQVWEQVREQVWGQVWEQVGSQVWEQVGDQVWEQVGEQVGDQVREQVWGQVGEQVWEQVWDQLFRAVYGGHDSGWLSFYDYFQEVAGLECCKRLEGIKQTAKSAGWWWPFAGAVILTERPVALHRDDQWRLHNESGPAMAYPDGFAIHAWHGVRVPKHVVTEPGSITVEEIKKEGNAEVRRVMLERFGFERYIRELGAKPIHTDDWGTLYRVKIEGDEDLMMVDVVNATPEPDGSMKNYMLRVHPELRPILNGAVAGEPQPLTARNAVASTFGETGESYARLLSNYEALGHGPAQS